MKILPVCVALGSMCLVGCVSNTDIGMNSNQWHLLNDKQKQNYQADYHEIQRYQKHRQYQPGASRISVRISGGSANMPPGFGSYRFYTAKFVIRDGQCRDVPLIAVQEARQANLTVCYTKQILSFDPSRYKIRDKEGTLFLNYNPVWRHGFEYYGLDSDGYVSLDNVDIRIQAVLNK